MTPYQTDERLKSYLDTNQIEAFDPTGAWWGLRSSASGEGPGFPVVVFGGDHADVPLEPHAGRMLARPLVEHGSAPLPPVELEPSKGHQSVAEKQVPATSHSGDLSTSEQKVLDALASLEAVGVEAPTKTQLAAFAGYSNPKSGGFAAPAAALVRKGLIESTAGKASMTSDGRDAANKPGRPATTKELQERIFSLLG